MSGAPENDQRGAARKGVAIAVLWAAIWAASGALTGRLWLGVPWLFWAHLALTLLAMAAGVHQVMRRMPAAADGKERAP